MKFWRLTNRIYRTVVVGSGGGFSPRKEVVVGSFRWHYSTLPAQRYTKRIPWNAPLIELSNRIRHIRDPSASVIPILDQWIQEVEYIHEDQLLLLIKNLRFRKRYAHALEISTWMTAKRHFLPTSPDVAIRLSLISKVHGIEAAENYFDKIPQHLKSHYVYGTLLNCYASVKSVEKTESVMQRMKDLGHAQTSLPYNVMLSLYYQTGNTEKLDYLMQDMEQNGINYDKHTYKILISAYAAVSDVDGLQKILRRMESDSTVVLDWATYAAAADGCRKIGLLDKTFEMLRITEGLITAHGRGAAYDSLIRLYAAAGRRDEVLRVWELYKRRVYNRKYVGVIATLLKLDDLENAERVFEEWESRNLWYDIIVPNFLIGAYSRKGLLDKAEALINRAISNGGKPNSYTWYYLAMGYVQSNQTSKAVESMKKAMLVCDPSWKSNDKILASCLDYFREEGDTSKLEDFFKSLGNHIVTSLGTEGRML
ncbi:hypothetical protein Tsubulata_017767 [Turnera subulata]|uniref:Pentacotripeptide-repeat region of PRORP domain-containing protein n=1 Tax=Turnera subulata TaxID=218843 RepID=A0A9Q0FJZ8_9ROSI|nr:hypothetical protein Tsubulata_017767 [Turnera subulata]